MSIVSTVTLKYSLSTGVWRERISKKRTKNEAKTTKPDTEWKSVEKTQSSQSPKNKLEKAFEKAQSKLNKVTGLDDSVYKTNASALIIEEWEFDSDDDFVIRPSFEQHKPSYAKINFVKTDENSRKSVIEGVMVKGKFDSIGTMLEVKLLMQSSPRAAVSISTARHVNTAALKQKVNAASPTKSSYFKAHSSLRRPSNQKSTAKANKFNKKVYTVNNVTTVGTEVVVKTAKGKRENC
ncbi:hypothetical protein Tco_1135089 [Tanacetum coccineum]